MPERRVCFAFDEHPTLTLNERVTEIVNALVGGNVFHEEPLWNK